MRCAECRETAAIVLRDRNGKRKALCGRHFIRHFEKRVSGTIKRFDLLGKKDAIAVACSGGKDSISVLDNLRRLGYNVTALAIDEGISGYRRHTLSDLKFFCDKNGIGLRVFSFKDEFGMTLDEILKKDKSLKPCTVCGTLRRFLLNKHSRGFDILATGHNLDDEAQAFMMNILKGMPLTSARLGPKSGILEDSKFTPRVKPLYLCSEKQVRLYAFLKGYNVSFNECPYRTESFRYSVSNELSKWEDKEPGTKERIVTNSLELLPRLKRFYIKEMLPDEKLEHCGLCGEPSKTAMCNACRILERLGLLGKK